jgi:hypothetical protein
LAARDPNKNLLRKRRKLHDCFPNLFFYPESGEAEPTD